MKSGLAMNCATAGFNFGQFMARAGIGDTGMAIAFLVLGLLSSGLAYWRWWQLSEVGL